MIKLTGKLKQHKMIMLISCCTLTFTIGYPQSSKSLTVDECYSLAEKNYPLVKQIALIEKTKEYSIDNAARGYLPQITISGQASYQSDVTSLPVSLPDVSIDQLSKDQYRIYAEVSQSLTDTYLIKQQKDLANANAETENQKIEVEFYKLKDRINQLFFGILLLEAQLEQNQLLKNDIQAGIDRTNAAVMNGIALKSNVDLLEVELLKADQRTIELKATRKGYASMLALFINQPVDENTQLLRPLIESISRDINRPELKLYEVQKRSFDIQKKLVTAKNIPRFSLFFQGGYGRPGLNQLSNEFDTYYIGGLRLNWNIGGLYTSKNEMQLISINQSTIDVQRETFLFNTTISMAQQNSEVRKFQELIRTDTEIIHLREKIKTTANNQLAYGTITSIDYLTYVNAADQAKQNQLLHQIQLLLAQYNYKTTSGN